MQKCDAVQERLANLVIRLACQSPENAAILVRPVLLLLQQRTAAAAKSLLSETDILQVLFGFSTAPCSTVITVLSDVSGQGNVNRLSSFYPNAGFLGGFVCGDPDCKPVRIC